MDSGAFSPRLGPGRPIFFWLGALAVTSGALLHVPMLLAAEHHDYMLDGMGWDATMVVAMALVGSGLAAVVWGLAPPRDALGTAAAASGLQVRALDDAPLTGAHVRLMIALTFALVIDTQKPFTFAFILPGVAHEYGLNAPGHPMPGALPVALLPFCGIVGTVLGSLIWGYLADRVGRRSTILLSAVVFVGTSACGAMPTYYWNLVMCFVMGLGVGGLVPIAYSLLAETVPARHRGRLVVLVGGIGTAGGFVLTSWCANWLVPQFGWRAMWFLGVPTGLALIALGREIPESPRFLLARGRIAEAEAVMRRFGASVQRSGPERARTVPVPSAVGGVFAPPFTRISLGLALYGLAWGLVNFGFLVWLPLDAGRLGSDVDAVTDVLAKAALFSLPSCVAVAWLYGRWSSKGTVIAAAVATVASLGVFAGAGGAIVRHEWLLTPLVVLLLVSMWAVVSVLAPYSVEVYPTASRAAGAGVAAGATKLGGVLALSMAVLGLTAPGIRGGALLAAVPMALAAAVLLVVGIETRGRPLDEIPSRLATGDA
jgi:putative MFS transporter